jgi:hypothetical protein
MTILVPDYLGKGLKKRELIAGTCNIFSSVLPGKKGGNMEKKRKKKWELTQNDNIGSALPGEKE